jgi:hypothetical protein
VLLPVSGLLTDPGTVCPGSTVVLNCTTSGGMGSFQIWSYNGAQLTSVTPRTTTPIDVERSGVVFSISLLSTTPDIMSQISFVASPSINGGTLTCAGGGGETDSVTLMVGSIQGNVRRGRLCVCMKSLQVKNPPCKLTLLCVCLDP